MTPAQYTAMRSRLRAALSNNSPTIRNPTEQDVLGFFGQFFATTSGSLPAAQQAAMNDLCRLQLSPNQYNPALANPSLADVTAFFSQLQTDASGASALSAQQYLNMLDALRGALTSNPLGSVNPSIADLSKYFAPYAQNDPTVLPGSANLAVWLRMDQGVTLRAAMAAQNSAVSTATLSGALTSAGVVPYIIVSLAGAVGVFQYYWSMDGGTTLTGPVISSAGPTALGSSGISVAFGAGTNPIGGNWRAQVAQIVSADANHWVFTATGKILMNWSVVGGKPSMDADGSTGFLECNSAGIANWFNGTNTAFSIYGVGKFIPTAGIQSFVCIGAASSANSSWDLFDNAGQWESFRVADGGGFAQVGPTGAITAAQLLALETFSTGTALSIIQNGSTIANASSQTTAASTLANSLCLFATNFAASHANFSNGQIAEIIIYSGNQHAVNSAAVTAYLNARYVDLVSTSIPLSQRLDSVAGISSVSGIAVNGPTTDVPNDYTEGDPGRRIKFTTSAASLQITAITFIDPWGAPAIIASDMDVWKDGAYSQTLSFANPMGIQQTQTLTLDGSAHTIEIDEQATVHHITGAIALTSYVAPNTRVVAYGDSITRGYQPAPVYAKGWASLMRHSLSATYQTTIWGVIGKQLFSDASTAPARAATAAALISRCDGSAKNIIVISLGTNDYSGGVLAATFQTWLDGLVVAINGLSATAKILLCSCIPRTGGSTPNGAGSTLANFNTAISAVQAAHPTFCTFLDLSTVLIDPTDLSDGIHPNNGGYVKMQTAIQTAVLAL